MPYLEAQRDFIASLVSNYEDMVRALSAFRRLAEGLKGKFTVKDISREVTGILAEELHLENCSIMLLDRDSRSLRLQAGSGSAYGHKRHTLTSSFKLGEGVAGIAAETKKPVLIHDTRRDPRFIDTGTAVEIGSILTIPILAGDETLGVINMSHPQTNFFNSRHVDIFGILSMIVGQLILFARMDEHLKERVEERTKELEDSRRFLESIINNANDVILTITRTGVISFVNKKVEDVGYRIDELCGRPYHIYTDEGADRRLLRMLLKKGKANWSIGVRDSGGEIRDFSCSIATVREDGRVSYFLVIARDVTEKRRVEKAIAMMDRLSSLGKMCAGIAHELNNRLVPIMSYSELLLSRDMDKDVKRMLNSIYDAAVGSRKIVHSLLDFARQKPSKKHPVDLNEVLEKTLSLFTYKLESYGHTINKRLAHKLSMVMADPHELEQVFINIINNAIQSMDRGGSLTIVSRDGDGRVFIDISDSGHGIPPEYIDKIFDPFFTTKDISKGTGLGLSVSYSIIQSHGGRMYVSSRVGKGTTFTIELPVLEKKVKEI